MNESNINLCTLTSDALWQCGTPEFKMVMITLLQIANHTGIETVWKGKKVNLFPGQMVTSFSFIKEKCGKGVSDGAVRCALNKLEKYGFIMKETSSTGTLISIVNWNKFQIEVDTCFTKLGHWQIQSCFYDCGLLYTDRVKCSVCKKFMCDKDFECIEELYPFCPHCGIEMDLDIPLERIEDLFEGT